MRSRELRFERNSLSVSDIQVEVLSERGIVTTIAVVVVLGMLAVVVKVPLTLASSPTLASRKGGTTENSIGLMRP